MYQCVLVLALPLRLLWPLTAPALGVRMSSERVVPAHIVHLNHHTLLRAYQLVPDEELSTEEEVEEEDHLKPSVNNPEAHRVEIEQPLKVLNTTNEYLNLMTAILNASPRSRRHLSRREDGSAERGARPRGPGEWCSWHPGCVLPRLQDVGVYRA